MNNKLHEYIERLANLMRNETRQAGTEYGLQPVQIEALKYLSLCNRYSDTPQGVTEYLGLTKGTVSQSIMILARKGLVEKQTDSNDKRVVHLSLTTTGKRLLKQVQPSLLLKGFSPNSIDLEATTEQLRQLLQSVQQENDLKTFGVCHSCHYNRKLANDKYLCGLTQEKLSKKDIRLICREHALMES